MQTIPFDIEHYDGPLKRAKGRIEITDETISIHFEGYGNRAAADGNVVGIQVNDEGGPEVLVWADYSNEEPTDVIDLVDAMEPSDA